MSVYKKQASRQAGKQASIVAAYVLLLSSPSVFADISGRVFNDINASGTFDTGASFNEVGLAAVTVKAFDVAGSQSAIATSAADGTYTLNGLTSGADYRLEFSWGNSWLKPGVAGGTSIQFVQDGENNVNLALSDPESFSQSQNPDLVLPQYIGGALTGGGRNNPALIGFKYLSSGDTLADHVPISTIGEMGSLWGLAYDKKAKILYAASTARRHASFGPTGASAIYRIDYSNPASPSLLGSTDLSGLLPSTADPRTATSFSPGPYSSYDPEIFDLVGKMSFGDIDISEDGKVLYVSNLTNKSVYAIDATKFPASLTNADVTQMSVGLDPGCPNGDYRPWAVKVHHGEVYAGVVCSAETSGQRNELAAYVRRWNGSQFVNVFGPVDLTYRKGKTADPVTTENTQWNPWVNDFSDLAINTPGGTDIGYPQPLLSDIEFDIDGSIILGFIDRTGLQTGRSNRPTDTNDTNTYSADSGGDILRICNVNGVLMLEGSDPACTTVNGNNNQGPNSTEFYWHDFTSGMQHQETGQGGLALLPGSGNVATTSMVPVNPRTGGVKWLNNVTGDEVRSYEVVNLPASGGGFGKASGVGDLEVLLEPAPVEIGNRVWLDTDGDGVQDAGEAGISGVTVELRSAGGSVLATVTTAADGTYYFSNASGTDVTGKKYGVTQLQPNTAFTLHFPTTTASYSLTSVKSGSNTLIDSDAAVATGDVTVAATDIPMAGANNHSFDVGYTAAAPPPSGCTTITNTAQITSVNQADTDNTNDSDSAAIQANCAVPSTDLKLVKTSSKSVVRHGEAVTYTLTLTNESSVDATNVQVTDNLPTGLTLVGSDPSQGTFSGGVWNVGTVTAGATVTLTIDVTVD